jgi:alkanesulfonate monooxygenase SsuD/methylene tetrahydromethanopterin reductase-like flavin-dependent oxidoreductase (luciferase family)
MPRLAATSRFRPVILTLAYDMRAPDFGTPASRLYEAALEQCAWADQRGFMAVTFMEHHASTDGYLPSPIVLASAAAARTKNMIISIALMILPLYEPLRLAEDLAVLDLVAQGRLYLIFGAGYREEEYEQFGRSIDDRPALMEHGVATLRQAWTGEPFAYEGRTVRILPRPHTPGGPPIILGGSSKAAARRAARIADGFLPSAPRFFEAYREELARLDKPVPPPVTNDDVGALFLHVSEDPERAWATIAPHAMHEMNEYGSWTNGNLDHPFQTVANLDELRASGRYLVLTPDECIAYARENGSLLIKPLMGGLDPDFAWESLELMESKVLPAIVPG